MVVAGHVRVPSLVEAEADPEAILCAPAGLLHTRAQELARGLVQCHIHRTAAAGAGVEVGQ